MNECEARNLIMDYLYAELEPEQEAEFILHLQECRKCSSEIEALRGLLDSYRKLPVAQPPANAAAAALARARGREVKSMQLPTRPGSMPSTRSGQPLVSPGHESRKPADAGEGADQAGNVVPLSRRFAFHPAWGLAAILILVFTVLIAMPDLEDDMKQGFVTEGNLHAKKPAAKTPAAEKEETGADAGIRPAKDMPESGLLKVVPQKRAGLNHPGLKLLEKDEQAGEKARALSTAPPALRGIRKGANQVAEHEHGPGSAYRRKSGRAEAPMISRSGRVAANKKYVDGKVRKSSGATTPVRGVSGLKSGPGGGGTGLAWARKREYRRRSVLRAQAEAAADADKEMIVRRGSVGALRTGKSPGVGNVKRKELSMRAPPAPAAPQPARARDRSTGTKAGQALADMNVETKADCAAVAVDGMKFSDTRVKDAGTAGMKAKHMKAKQRSTMRVQKRYRAENLVAARVQADRAVRAAGPVALQSMKKANRKTAKVVEEGSRRQVDLLQQARLAFAAHDYSRALELINRICKTGHAGRAVPAAQTIAALTLKARCEIALQRPAAAAITMEALRKQDSAAAAALSRELRVLKSESAEPPEPVPAAPAKPVRRKFSTDAYDE